MCRYFEWSIPLYVDPSVDCSCHELFEIYRINFIPSARNEPLIRVAIDCLCPAFRGGYGSLGF